MVEQNEFPGNLIHRTFFVLEIANVTSFELLNLLFRGYSFVGFEETTIGKYT